MLFRSTVSLGIALGDNGQVLSWSLLSRLKGKSDDSLDSVSCEDGNFGGGFPCLAAVGATALAGVFTLAVFTDDDPVQVTGCGVSEG